MREPFCFGIPLIAPAAARDWSRVDELLSATLRSLLGQSDGDFRILIAGHESPPCMRALEDRRIEFLKADWPVAVPTFANDDGGAKKWMIKQAVQKTGGALLMFVDADDLVDRETVAVARARIDRRQRGGVIGGGFAIDFATRRAVALPDERLFGLAFHEVCGSSIIGRIESGAGDPFDELSWHNRWPQCASERGEAIAILPIAGGYLVNTGESHSENHGPFTDWRRDFARRVRELGTGLSRGARQRFSIEEPQLVEAA